MRIATVFLRALSALCVVACLGLQGEDGGNEAVKKVGQLKIATDDDGKVTTATLVCGDPDAWEDVTSYTLKLNDETQKQAIALKGKQVVVTGTLKVNEDELFDTIVVTKITAAPEKAPVPAAPAEAEGGDED